MGILGTVTPCKLLFNINPSTVFR